MPSQACELATKKAHSWIALVTIGSSILMTVIILAMIGLAFGVPEVADFLLTIHYNGTLYFIVIAGVILIVMALMKRATKNTFCMQSVQ